ncbi:MAG TPA: 2,3,4,5-tetrahydropyridine-2,6-dicarboxylate N-succinyltransferase, partial [Balneola sp.]|nr:2,3,4,5-tetrahydropyridine-2,6-dicarboxylate N-succinyltransferase [Balneola sp.]
MNYEEILDKLETGELRSATINNGKWEANIDVKKAILESFKNGENASY